MYEEFLTPESKRIYHAAEAEGALEAEMRLARTRLAEALKRRDGAEEREWIKLIAALERGRDGLARSNQEKVNQAVNQARNAAGTRIIERERRRGAEEDARRRAQAGMAEEGWTAFSYSAF